MHLHLITNSFRTERSADYFLYVQLENDGLTYCIVDPAINMCLAFIRHTFSLRVSGGERTDRLEAVIREDKNLTLQYKSVLILHYSQHSTLVPAVLFDESLAADYLRYNHYPDDKSEIFTDYIEPISAYNVFSIPEKIVAFFRNKYEIIAFKHHSTPFICNASVSGIGNETTVHAGINSGFIDIAVFKNNKLEIYNNFQYASEADLLYYILYVYRQMSLDPESNRLFISGEMSRKLSYIEILKQNFVKTEHSAADQNIRLAPELNSLHIYKYLNLFSLFSCALPEENIKAEK